MGPLSNPIDDLMKNLGIIRRVFIFVPYMDVNDGRPFIFTAERSGYDLFNRYGDMRRILFFGNGSCRSDRYNQFFHVKYFSFLFLIKHRHVF